MENKNVDEIVPAAEGNDGVQAIELADGGENKSSENDGGINEETKPMNVVVADEKEVTPAPGLTVVDDEQQKMTALTVTRDGGEVAVAIGAVEVTVASGAGEVAVEIGGGEVAVARGGGEVTVASGRGEVTVASGGGEVMVADEKQEVTMALTVASGGGGGEVTVASLGGGEGRGKKQRGRPRKEGEEELMGMIEFSPTQKRGRGRPKGTGKLQRLAMAASLGDANANVNAYAGETGGSNFTPHIMTVQKGENIVERIRSFCESTTESVCIISACGTVSIADLYASLPRPGILRYEGELSIVTLNGSHTYTKNMAGKVFVMSVQLAYPDSRLCGGAVAASLIAAAPTQVMMATFKQNRQQHKSGSASGSKGGMRLVAVAERVNSGQPALAQPIGSTQI